MSPSSSLSCGEGGREGGGDGSSFRMSSSASSMVQGAAAGDSTPSSGNSQLKRVRLLKRTSVDILPHYSQFKNDLNKLSKTDGRGTPSVETSTKEDEGGLERGGGEGVLQAGDPMISRCDRDLNSPIMFLHHGVESFDSSVDHSLCLDDVLSESTAMDMGG